MRSEVKPITVDWVRDRAALMDCAKYAAPPRHFLGETRSQAEQFNADLKALKEVPTADAKKIDDIEKIFLNELKKDLLLYAAYREPEFKRIKEQLTQCPLNDENKSDINTYLAHCEKYKDRYKRIETHGNQLLAMSSAANHAKDSVFEAFCGSIKERLDTAKESLKDPAKVIPDLPLASWVEKAYKEAKSDLNYCKTGAEKQTLLQKKLDVYLMDAAVSKAENPTLAKLNALQAKLEYQVLLYTTRQGASKEYYGFFKFGHSASDKLKETNAMLQEVTRLKDKPDTAPEWTAGDAAKQGALKDLYKELKSLGGIEKPPTAAPKP